MKIIYMSVYIYMYVNCIYIIYFLRFFSITGYYKILTSSLCDIYARSWLHIVGQLILSKKNFFWLCCLHCYLRAFSSCSQQGLLFFDVHELLLTVGSRCTGFCSCDSGSRVQAVALHSMWNLPAPGIELVSPALADEFVSTAPPGKSLDNCEDIMHLCRPELKCWRLGFKFQPCRLASVPVRACFPICNT